MFDTLELNNPIVFGLIGSLIIYVILLLEKRQINNREIAKAKLNNTTLNIDKSNISLKLPIIVGVMMWGSTSYFNTLDSDNQPNINIQSRGRSIPILDQEIFTDRADF